jgi:hypothetical protein
LEYDLYRKRFPNGPTDLTDPQTNLRIMILGLDARQEQGVTAEEHNQPHALTNWFTTTAAYFGAGSNEGINAKTDRFGTSGFTYVGRVRQYMRDVLRLSDTQIDAIAGGENIGQDLESGEGTPYDYDLPGTEIATSFGGILLEGFKRALPLAFGLVLLIFGLYKVASA